MEPLFENQTTLSKKTYVEGALSANKTVISIILFFAGIGLIDTGYKAYMIKEYMLLLCCIGGAIIAFTTPFYIYRSQGVKNYKNQLLLSEGIEPKVNVTLYEDYLTFNKFIPTINENKMGYKSEAETSIKHDKITVVHNLKENFVIVYANQIYLPVQKTGFTKGSPEEFEEFLLKKGIKVKRKIL
ncbi:hypothetical protein GMA92_09570 [Turicibacter sanguinis]|uniref:YcxB-like protein domain-containing protein n=1 Tax=Turicibacter sanguinis TaxID=154288 RepID=A0A9X4XE14_9FIRM|nr:hypothetical protein [Turicibacter sanguinis]KAB6699918.1 hypothetical protein GAZ90_19345 [Phocaeicola vulgatus]MTK21668.1 hypothetical protein [Turicibacter sanguinis]MTK73148.1 hypothetical protein [Turicibacter sanguinis]